MRREQVAGQELDRCARCAGVWLDPGEGEPLTRPEAELPTAYRALRSGRSTGKSFRPAPVNCPRCGKPMQQERYAESAVTIDRCACGVFLDGGEVEKIQRYRKTKLDAIMKRNPDADRDELEKAFARIYFEVGKRKA